MLLCYYKEEWQNSSLMRLIQQKRIKLSFLKPRQQAFGTLPHAQNWLPGHSCEDKPLFNVKNHNSQKVAFRTSVKFLKNSTWVFLNPCDPLDRRRGNGTWERFLSLVDAIELLLRKHFLQSGERRCIPPFSPPPPCSQVGNRILGKLVINIWGTSGKKRENQDVILFL